MYRLRKLLALGALAAASPCVAQDTFVNFESAHVHPLDLTPDASTLLAVNTAAARLEVFDVNDATGLLTRRGSVRVGMDPVTVRALTNDLAWVVNQISDSIAIVDVNTLALLDTLRTPDEPCDVVFTGTGGGSTVGTAWVSCAQPAVIARFDLANLGAAPQTDSIHGKDPTAMAVSPNGDRVYVALRTSGNRTTVLAGGQGMMPNVVSDPSGPHNGANPPPNVPASSSWDPALNPKLDPNDLPEAALIVRQPTVGGAWVDDTGADWTPFVSGASAPQYGRVQNWGMADHDVAIIDATASTFSVTFAKDCMNIVSAIAIQPIGTSHGVSVVGTEAINERRFEPNLNGVFARAVGALVDPVTATRAAPVVDLNPQLIPYSSASQGNQDARDDAIGDPRALVFSPSGGSAWIAGMGSNNVGHLDFVAGARTVIEVGSGPTGLALNAAGDRLYVLNKFEGSVTVLDDTDAVLGTTPYPDPTPLAVKRGRKHLYDTHRTSGNGHVSCASCHVDARMDGLAWDLGNPAGQIRFAGEYNDNLDFPLVILPEDSEYHPMKGPMTTQTLQDIVGKEPFHWRGDRRGLEEFNGAYEGLQGDDAQLTAAEMQEFEDFLASIWMPPNPFRFVTNDFNTGLDLAPFGMREFSQGWFPGTPAPSPLGVGDAHAALDVFRTGNISNISNCVTCHSLPVGIGPDHVWDLPSAPGVWTPMPRGEYGNAHSALESFDLPAPASILKVAQLRNLHEKTGFDLASTESLAGFGYLHDGSVDTIGTFLSNPDAFNFNNVPGLSANQAISDMTAFLLSFSGSRMPVGDVANRAEPPGVPGQNAHAGIGLQVTLTSIAPPVLPSVLQTFSDMMFLQDSAVANGHNDIALVAVQNLAGGGQSGFRYAGGLMFDDDRGGQIDVFTLIGKIGSGTEITLMAVPFSESTRLGIDADGDGVFDRVELAAGSDPEDPLSSGACTATVPAPPRSVVATVVADYEVDVAWVDNSSDEDGFVVERAWTNSPQFEVVGIIETPNVQTFVDRSVGVDTDYVYRVRSFNCAGRSVASATSPSVTSGGFVTPTVVHVSDMDFLEEPPSPTANFWGKVTVVDDQGRVVEGVRVAISASGGVTQSAATNDQGQALFSIPLSSLPAAPITVMVTNLSSATTVYDPTANFITNIVYPP
ncbi:MAG: beta-propeller fold lactonase family protein [Planctomycetota bacterium]